MKTLYSRIIAVVAIIFASMGISALAYYPSTYKGTLEIDLTGMGMAKTTVDEQRVVITPTTYGYCKVEILDYKVANEDLGDIVIGDATLSDGTDGGFNISGSVGGFTLSDGNSAEVSINGTLDVDGNLNLNIDVTSNGVTYPATFSGAYYDDAGIASITDNAGETAYYRLDGSRLHKAPTAAGLYIMRQGNASTKILVR